MSWSTYVVAAEVDEHDVFAAFFFIGEHFGFEGEVFGFVGGALAGAGDGAVLDGALVDADEQLGGGAGDFEAAGDWLAGPGGFGCFGGGWGVWGDAQEVHVG